MKPELSRLFAQEMQSLLAEGADFARDFPEAARFLDPASTEHHDPYVDRLTEGVAFLTTRIREELVQDDGGIPAHLLDMIAPDLIEPLPSVCVVHFSPAEHLLEGVLVPAGALVKSKKMPGALAGIRFRLLHPVRVLPMRIESAGMRISEKLEGILELKLSWNSIRGVHPWPDPLPIYLQGDGPVIWALRYLLVRQIKTVKVKFEEEWIEVNGVSFSEAELPCYTTENDMAVPLAKARDFFCADQRFRFLRMSGAKGLPFGVAHPLHIQITFEGKMLPGFERNIKPQVFQLHTGIVVNRLPEELEPIYWSNTQIDMPLRPMDGAHREVITATKVQGTFGNLRTEYHRYSSYRPNAEKGTFSLRRKPLSNGSDRVFLGISHGDPLRSQSEQYLSIQGTCCDGDNPYQHLEAKNLCLNGFGIPSEVGVQGISRPTRIYRKPSKPSYLSEVLAYSQGHFEGWLDAKRLREGLSQVLWDPAAAKQSLIDSIKDIQSSVDLVLDKGVAWRRLACNIELRDTTCTSETWDRLGVIDTFGSILEYFVRDQTPIGFRYQLKIIIEPSGVTLSYGSGT